MSLNQKLVASNGRSRTVEYVAEYAVEYAIEYAVEYGVEYGQASCTGSCPVDRVIRAHAGTVAIETVARAFDTCLVKLTKLSSQSRSGERSIVVRANG